MRVFVYTVLCLFPVFTKTGIYRHILLNLSKVMLNYNPFTCFVSLYEDRHSIMGTFLQPKHTLE